MTHLAVLPATVPAGDRYEQEARRSHQGMAHFAGTGPVGTYCGSCVEHKKKPGGQKLVCFRFKRMAGRWGADVPAAADSCRHYVKKETR